MVVHDSFACGIGDMDKLSFALRDQLVELYRNYNLYEDLLKQAKALHPDPDSVNWPELPERGDDEGNLLTSMRFTSLKGASIKRNSNYPASLYTGGFSVAFFNVQ